jgi:hypothetical protein
MRDRQHVGIHTTMVSFYRPPFLADTQAQLSARIKEGRVQSLPGNYTQELNQIVKWMLRVDVGFQGQPYSLLTEWKSE